MSLFIEIISESENINQLPNLSEIYEKIEKRTNEDAYDDETEKLEEEWDNTIITLKDETIIELINDHRCILHDFKFYEGTKAYKISDENLYICADCLTICKEYDKLVEEHYNYCSEKLLIPKSWDENGIINWLRKQNEREEEYFSRKCSYNYENEYNDYEDYDEEFDSYENFLESENDYLEQLIAENKRKELRNNTWKSEECQRLYDRLISYMNGKANLRKSQLSQAKNLAVDICINKIEPNFEKFKLSIEKSNEKYILKNRIKKENLAKLNDLKYAVVNNNIFKIIDIGLPNRKGTSVHLELEESNIYLVSCKKLFCTLEEAESYYNETYK